MTRSSSACACETAIAQDAETTIAVASRTVLILVPPSFPVLAHSTASFEAELRQHVVLACRDHDSQASNAGSVRRPGCARTQVRAAIQCAMRRRRARPDR